MSMNNENNFTSPYVSGSPFAPANTTSDNSGFRTAGQAMQPPILSPSTVNDPKSFAPVLTPQTLAFQQSSVTIEAAPSKKELKKKAKAEKKAQKAAASTAAKAPANSGAKRVAAVAVAFCMLGAGLGVCGTVAYGIHWSDKVRSEAVSAAKKAVQKDGSGKTTAPAGKNNSTVLEGDRDHAVLNTNSIDTSKVHTASEIYAANVNSTVGIKTSIDYNYYGYKTTAAASGSGFILTADGYVVTNYHVIEDAKDIQVTTYDDTTYDASIVGYDIDNDLAVLKIEADGLTPVILGDSDNMNVGDEVIAIGNPLGELTFSLTKGCVSALNRTVTINNAHMNLIQTDCAINSGNSGGALFNMYGEVIGITNAKYSNNGGTDATIESIGFAIPINSVRDIIESIIEKGYAEKPFIGVYAETVTDQTDYDADSGIGIHDIMPDSPAEEAGIQPGDVIIKIDGKKVKDVAELKVNINRAGVGGKLTLTILRDGKEIEIVVDVAADQSS